MQESYPVMLSIYMATYNHENYITRALDSILMQKTQYTYEVLVGEDASTDSTRKILQDYEQEHPGKLTVFYREENMSKKEISNALDLKLRCRGKYIICLEGDDFWTDENKIEKQINFLEEHPEYIAVAHNCVVVGEDSQPNGERYAECRDAEYTFQHFFSNIMPGQYATLMARNYMIDEEFDRALVTSRLAPGDRLTYFSLLCHGRIYCMQEVMSAYRHITTYGTSFSARHRFHYQQNRAWGEALLEYASKHCDKTIVYNATYPLLYGVVMGVAQKQLTVPEAMREFVHIPHRFPAFVAAVRRFVRRYLLHKDLFA